MNNPSDPVSWTPRIDTLVPPVGTRLDFAELHAMGVRGVIDLRLPGVAVQKAATDALAHPIDRVRPVADIVEDPIARLAWLPGAALTSLVRHHGGLVVVCDDRPTAAQAMYLLLRACGLDASQALASVAVAPGLDLAAMTERAIREAEHVLKCLRALPR